MKTYTVKEAATDLGIDVSRVQKLCRDRRLGYELPRHGRAWVVTEAEIVKYKQLGSLPVGRPKTK